MACKHLDFNFDLEFDMWNSLVIWYIVESGVICEIKWYSLV